MLIWIAWTEPEELSCRQFNDCSGEWSKGKNPFNLCWMVEKVSRSVSNWTHDVNVDEDVNVDMDGYYIYIHIICVCVCALFAKLYYVLSLSPMFYLNRGSYVYVCVFDLILYAE